MVSNKAILAVESAPERETGTVESPCGKAAGRPRTSELEARNQNLIETAGKLFLLKGYSKVSLEMIAREAHVAVRTIYVKFGGKAGLFSAVLIANRNRYFSDISKIECDQRPVREILNEFSERFLNLITAPAALAMQRMVIAEATSNPEVAQTFFETGPRQTRALLMRFFERPSVRAQLRDDVPLEMVPVHLLNCIVGDQFSRFLFAPDDAIHDAGARALHQRLDLFYRSVLRQPEN
jgi:TetR/AcrR family transcriptional repressor of mexJK operon